MAIGLFLLICFLVTGVLTFLSNWTKGDGEPYGIPAVIIGIYSIGLAIYMMSGGGERERTAKDAVVTTIQKAYDLGKGLEFIEVYGRKIAINRTMGGNTQIDVDDKTVLFQSAAYPTDSVFVYNTVQTPLYGVLYYSSERIEIYDKPVYAYDREVLLIRSDAATQIPVQQ